MRRTPWPRLVLLTLATALVTTLGLRLAERQGVTVLPLPWQSGAVVLVIAAWVGRMGWTVRQYTRGRRPRLDPLVAARTVVLATASAYTGALLTGWYAGHVLLAVGDLAIESRRDLAVSALVALACTVALAVVGLVVERWCEVRPRDDDEDPGTGASAASGSTA